MGQNCLYSPVQQWGTIMKLPIILILIVEFSWRTSTSVFMVQVDSEHTQSCNNSVFIRCPALAACIPAKAAREPQHICRWPHNAMSKDGTPLILKEYILQLAKRRDVCVNLWNIQIQNFQFSSLSEITHMILALLENRGIDFHLEMAQNCLTHRYRLE